MHITDAYDRFDAEFSYPIDRADVIEAVGDTTISAPTDAPESIAEVLERADATTFDSPRELHETVLCHVGDQYIGRKFYDDRGMNLGPGDAATF